MIVRMQKVTILVASRHTDDALMALRKLGVVHIEHLREPLAEGITALERRISDIDTVLSVVSASQSQRQKKDKEEESLLSYLKEIIAISREKQRLLEDRQKLEEKIRRFEEWGEISPSSVSTIEKAGVFVKLYVGKKKFLKNIASDKMIHIIKEKKGEVYLALISTSIDDSLDLPEVMLPDEHLHWLQKRRFEANKRLESINERLNSLAQYRNSFAKYKDALIKKREFYRVKFGMAKEEGFAYLQGFCPREDMAGVNRLASKEGWAVLSEEPDQPEKVPTFVKNPKWIDIISPVFKFMGTLPGYKEYDISFWFLLFFSVFFALLIGDAGYGLVFLLITFLVKKKARKVPPEPIFLMFVLSSATIVWGAVTGTWFGVEKIAQSPFFNFLVIDRINSFVASNQVFMMYLCFLIGVIHLTVAHSIIAFRFINSLFALAQLGWICILWGLFFIAGEIVLDKPLPQISGSLFLAGVTLVALFSNPQKNILKGILVSLGELPLKVISSFSDVVSYVRLFAVGYASVIMATSFNNMALGVGFNNIFSGLFAALILFLGHSLNILLGLMGVVVHGIRLNMLEFSGHLNMQWSGEKYRPFK